MTALATPPVQRLFGEPGQWVQVRDADPSARRLFDRHYSRRRYQDGRQPKKFIGPGSYVALVLPDVSALFVWRKFIDDADDGSGQPQQGINCAVFRNESAFRSSDLIRQAEPWAQRRWPDAQRFYTYVNAEQVRHKRDPGRCFLRAGWRYAGQTKGGLLILEKEPTP